MQSHRKKAGKFTVTVSSPSPRWVTIERDNGDSFHTLALEDINDLIYALERAVTLAKAEDDERRERNETS